MTSMRCWPAVTSTDRGGTTFSTILGARKSRKDSLNFAHFPLGRSQLHSSRSSTAAMPQRSLVTVTATVSSRGETSTFWAFPEGDEHAEETERRAEAILLHGARGDPRRRPERSKGAMETATERIYHGPPDAGVARRQSMPSEAAIAVCAHGLAHALRERRIERDVIARGVFTSVPRQPSQRAAFAWPRREARTRVLPPV